MKLELKFLVACLELKSGPEDIPVVGELDEMPGMLNRDVRRASERPTRGGRAASSRAGFRRPENSAAGATRSARVVAIVPGLRTPMPPRARRPAPRPPES